MKYILQNATIKNASWIIVGKIAQMVIKLIIGLLTARYLGPANYGLINYSAAYTAFFMAFCTLGINSILVKEFIDNPEDEGKIIGSSLVMRAISSFLSSMVIVMLVCIVDANETTTIAVTVLSCIGLFFHIFETINYWFQSKLNSKVTAIVSLIAYVITSIYKVFLLAAGKSVEWFAFATSVDYICVGILLLICYKQYGGQRLSFSKDTCIRLLNKSVHFILPSLMVAIYGYTDKFMLKQMLCDSEVGYYSTSVAICSLWSFVLYAIIDSFYPTIMELYKKDYKCYEIKNRQLYAIIFYISIFVSIVFCAFGRWIVLIMYGQSFLPSVNSLRIVTWYTAFSFLGVARNAWIVCENKQKYLKYIYATAAISNILLNVFLIPNFGAEGAATASLITQILTTIIIPFFIKEIRKNTILIIEGISLKYIRG